MDYDDIENLVTLAKAGDTEAKEKLAREFTPLILKLSGKSFINSYQFSDIRNECYRILFRCVSLYSLNRHRFVAYATNAIKNSINHLIRVSVRRNKTEGPAALVLDGSLENILSCDIEDTEDLLLSENYRKKLKTAFENLNTTEKDLIYYLYFKHYSIKSYALLKELPYSTAVKRKNAVLRKLRNLLTAAPLSPTELKRQRQAHHHRRCHCKN